MQPTLGRYELRDKIGAGGMAEAWVADVHLADGTSRSVVVKKMLPHLASDPEYQAMFIDEARIASSLKHPNVVQLFDIGKMGDAPFIALEYVDGADLRIILRAAETTGRPLSIVSAVWAVREVLQGLEYVHTRTGPDGELLHLVHRDVGLSNVLVSRRGDVKLSDFGIAKSAISISRTAAGIIKGNLLSMAPEQIEGEGVTLRTDIYAAGLLLHSLLIGRHPLEDFQVARLFDMHARGKLPSVAEARPDIDPQLVAIVQRATSRRPEDRFASAGNFAEVLLEFSRRTGVELGPVSLAAELDAIYEAARASDQSLAGAARPVTFREAVTTLVQRAARQPVVESATSRVAFTPMPFAPPVPEPALPETTPSRPATLLATPMVAPPAPRGAPPPPGTPVPPTNLVSPLLPVVASAAWIASPLPIAATTPPLRPLSTLPAPAPATVPPIPVARLPTPPLPFAPPAPPAAPLPAGVVVPVEPDPHAVSAPASLPVPVVAPRVPLAIRATFLATLAGHRQTINAIVAGPGVVASAGSDGNIIVWNVGAREAAAILRGHTSAVSTLAASVDGGLLLSGSRDGTLRLWKAGISSAMLVMKGRGRVSAVAIRADGGLAISGEDRALQIWDLVSGSPLHTIEGAHRDFITAVAFVPSANFALSGSVDRAITLWDAGSRVPLRTMTGRERVRTVNVDPSGRYVLAGMADGSLALWDLSTGEWKDTLSGHKDAVGAVCYASGRMAFSGGLDGSIRAWDLKARKEIATITPPSNDPILALGYAENRLFAASGSDFLMWQIEGPDSG